MKSLTWALDLFLGFRHVSHTLDVEPEAVVAAAAENAQDVQASFEELTAELQNPNAE